MRNEIELKKKNYKGNYKERERYVNHLNVKKTIKEDLAISETIQKVCVTKLPLTHIKIF